MYFSFLSRDNERQIGTGHTALFVLETRILYINYQIFMMWYLSIRNATLKAGANEETLFQKQNWVQGANFVSSTYVAWVRKRGNIEEALIFNVSRLFLRLRAKATCSEDAKFASGKQKCLASFPFARWLTHATL